jgi:3-dehydroquinate synthase
MFSSLQQHQLVDYIQDAKLLSDIIQKNVAIKLDIVAQDVFEKKERLFLNFGHTLGHAIENTALIQHGYAVAIGMRFACQLSEKVTGFNPNQTAKIIQLLQQYQLPTSVKFDVDTVINLVQSDKKRTGKEIRFVLLKAIGEASVHAIPIETIRTHLIELSS